MIQAPNLPMWAALIVGILLLSGASLTLLGAIGLVSLKSFYERAHAPGLGAAMGAILILAASMICFSVLQSRPIIHEILIFIFVSITTPITLLLLCRASIYRDRAELGMDHAPPDLARAQPAAPNNNDC
jgi:multicomponent K+:H+ antiporter subunit G